jgi:hypothetical protein
VSRRENVRYAFLSDDKILELFSSVLNKGEFFQILKELFEGVHHFILEKLKSESEQFFVTGVVNHYREKVVFQEPVYYDQSSQEEPPVFGIVKELENSIGFILRRQMLENVMNVGRLNFVFREVWKNFLENKYVSF